MSTSLSSLVYKLSEIYKKKKQKKKKKKKKVKKKKKKKECKRCEEKRKTKYQNAFLLGLKVIN